MKQSWSLECLICSLGYNPRITYPVVSHLGFKQLVVLVSVYCLVLLLPAELLLPLEVILAFSKMNLNVESVLSLACNHSQINSFWELEKHTASKAEQKLEIHWELWAFIPARISKRSQFGFFKRRNGSASVLMELKLWAVGVIPSWSGACQHKPGPVQRRNVLELSPLGSLSKCWLKQIFKYKQAKQYLIFPLFLWNEWG